GYTIFSSPPKMKLWVLVGLIPIIWGGILFGDILESYFEIVDPELARSFRVATSKAFEVFENKGEVRSVTHLASMEIPPLTFETIWGTGQIRPNFGVGHDSGYIHNYFGIGLIGATIFYLAFMAFLFKYAVRMSSPYLGLALFLMF